MKQKFTLTLLVFFLSFFNLINAQNQTLITKVLKQLKLENKEVNTELLVTKILPYDKTKTVLVIPKYVTNNADEEFYVYDAYIIVANNQTNEIISKYYEAEKWTSDALVFDDIIIDTGLYKFNETTRAFGVRTHYTGSSRINPYGNTTLSLFILEGTQLKQVANNITVYNYSGDWDGNCTGEFINEEITIDIDSEKTNGFNNLILKNKITKTTSFKKGNDCEDKVSTKNETSKLKFNGTVYK